LHQILPAKIVQVVQTVQGVYLAHSLSYGPVITACQIDEKTPS
jgi:hypothetical protein